MKISYNEYNELCVYRMVNDCLDLVSFPACYPNEVNAEVVDRLRGILKDVEDYGDRKILVEIIKHFERKMKDEDQYSYQ